MVRPDLNNTSGRLWVEEGVHREGTVADVAPMIPVDKTYSFAVPDELADALALGQRVRVPLGRRGRLVSGFVVALDHRRWDSTLRPIHSLIDDASFLTPDLIALGREMAAHYVCSLGRVLKAMTPEAVRRETGLKIVRYVRLCRPADEIVNGPERITPQRRAIVERLAGADEPVSEEDLLRAAGTSRSTLQGMESLGWIEIIARKEVPPDRFQPRVPRESDFLLSEDQQRALAAVNQAIDAAAFSVTLLFGVSGSGKTEVYIHAMRRVVAEGKQAILLVPEIVLTTQLVQRLAARFDDVAVVHSGLTGAQRSIIWRRIAAGDKPIIIGPRSAVFAPCPNLGLTCVDEEQETSFKNLQAPRFNVRDVAIMRGRHLNIPIVLGSATPSVETWYHSEHRLEYRRVALLRRVMDRKLPKVHLIDMEAEFAEQKCTAVFSRTTQRLLKETLERNEQALLLINRRGFAHRIICPTCKTKITCPNCNVGMVVHSAAGISVCHHCHTRIPTPTVCPNVSCGEKLMQFGLGTQRVEDVLGDCFPDARVARVDSDTMNHREKYERIVADFTARKIDVLVGTQMIAKGLDFPFVSFVGVIHADPAGLATDFRANERVFQLVTQVAGRAGRAEAAGQVVVQTTMPDLPALRHALEHDYESFVAEELTMRRQAGLPPFRRLARIVLADKRADRARLGAEALAGRIRQAIGELREEEERRAVTKLQSHEGGERDEATKRRSDEGALQTAGHESPPSAPETPQSTESSPQALRPNPQFATRSPQSTYLWPFADVLGPSPCALPRLRGRYRFDLLVRTPNATTMRALMAHLDRAGALRTKAQSTIIDVDPVDMG